LQAPSLWVTDMVGPHLERSSNAGLSTQTVGYVRRAAMKVPPPSTITRSKPRSSKYARTVWLKVGFAGVLLGALLGTSALRALRFVLQERHLQPARFSRTGSDFWALDALPDTPGYFVDIGAFGAHGFSNTRNLERRGWSGICADPMPRGFEERTCGTVPRPIGARSGMRLPPSEGCEKPEASQLNCTLSQLTTVGLADLLAMVEAPSTIDLVSISARGTGAEVLDGFPWESYCGRLWTVELGDEDATAQGGKTKALLTSRGCHAIVQGADLWAVCSCKTSSVH